MMNLKAFTLLELLLVVAMLAILGMILGPILGNAVQGSTVIWSRKQTLAEARNGMDRMTREIRLIPNSGVLANIGATNLQFQYPEGTDITYSLNGTNLLRNSDVLIGSVTSLAFSYYDESGNTTATAANVRSIGIQLTVLATASNSNLTLRTRVFLRNTGHDYENFTSP